MRLSTKETGYVAYVAIGLEDIAMMMQNCGYDEDDNFCTVVADEASDDIEDAIRNEGIYRAIVSMIDDAFRDEGITRLAAGVAEHWPENQAHGSVACFGWTRDDILMVAKELGYATEELDEDDPLISSIATEIDCILNSMELFDDASEVVRRACDCLRDEYIEAVAAADNYVSGVGGAPYADFETPMKDIFWDRVHQIEGLDENLNVCELCEENTQQGGE